MYVQLKPGVPSCWLTLRALPVHPALPAEIDNASLQRLQAVHLLAAKRLSEIAKTMYLLAIELTPAKAQELLENVEAYKARMLGLGNELPAHESGLPLTPWLFLLQLLHAIASPLPKMLPIWTALFTSFPSIGDTSYVR